MLNRFFLVWRLLDKGQDVSCFCPINYILKNLFRFGITSAKSLNTLSLANFKPSKAMTSQSESNIEYMKKVPYSSVVGCLIYVMVCTRHEISHSISMVSRYMAYACKKHWVAMKRIFRYLKSTSEVGLICGGKEECLVTGHLDLDYAVVLGSRRSLTWYVFCS